MLWKKTTPNDGPGFPPNVTVTSVATPYKRLAAELQCFPDTRILNFFVSKFKIKWSGKKQCQTTEQDFVHSHTDQ